MQVQTDKNRSKTELRSRDRLGGVDVFKGLGGTVSMKTKRQRLIEFAKRLRKKRDQRSMYTIRMSSDGQLKRVIRPDVIRAAARAGIPVE